MKQFLFALVGCATLILSAGEAMSQEVEPLVRIRVIQTQLFYNVEVLATREALEKNPGLDAVETKNTPEELVVFLSSDDVLVRPLEPANGNNVFVEYAPWQFLLPFTNFGAATPYNTGGGPTNINSFSFTTQTSPIFPRLLGTAGYLSLRVNPDCPNCR